MDLAIVPSIYKVVHAWGHIPKIDMAIMSSRGQILTTLGDTNGIDSTHTYRKDELFFTHTVDFLESWLKCKWYFVTEIVLTYCEKQLF